MVDYEKVRVLQAEALEMFGNRLRMKPCDVLALADEVKRRGVPFRCFLAFAYRNYFHQFADKLIYKNFLASPKRLEAFDKYLKFLRDATPMRIQRDWEQMEIYEGQMSLRKTLTSDFADLSPLFRYVMLNTLGDRACAKWKEDAIIQLRENPFYFDLQPEQIEFYPIRKEGL